MQRFDNAKYTRLQFLRAISHAVGSDKMISDNQSDSDDDDDTEDEDDRTQPQPATNTSNAAGTTSTVSADAVDSCEVCFVAPRDARFALVPCGHQRFCQRSARPKSWTSALPHTHHNVLTGLNQNSTVLLLQYSSFPLTDVCAIHFVITVASQCNFRK